MSVTILRPGLNLLRSLLAGERRGFPGPAREAALAAAHADPGQAHVHLFDAVFAALVAGEPRAAARLLDQATAAAPDDAVWRRRAAACRSWIWTVEWNWYPGDTAAEPTPTPRPPAPEPAPGDPETVLVEALAAGVDEILSARFLLEVLTRTSPAAVPECLAIVPPTLQRVGDALVGVGAGLSTGWLGQAWADLLHRGGGEQEAAARLESVRAYASAAAHDVGDRVGLAGSYLVEGDWYATPGSSPETLGFTLAQQAAPSPYAGRQDYGRAAAAYERAEAALGDADEPRLRGALALRRATLAGTRQDYDEQLSELDAARAEFDRAGDAAACWLVAVHHLLADIASGKIARTRSAHGTAFDLTPRGTIGELLRWREEAGSASWTTGLGRMLQRAAEAWAFFGDYDRAEVAYGMALPLVPVSGAEVAAAVLVETAGVEAQQRLTVRATTRLSQALATLPPVEDLAHRPIAWLRQLMTANFLLQALLGEGASGAGAGAGGLVPAIARVRALLAAPGVPEAGSGGVLSPERLQAFFRAGPGNTLQALERLAEQEVPERLREFVAISADMARGLLATAEATLAFARGREAARIGAETRAARYFDEASSKAASAGGESAFVAVTVLAATGRFDAARALLHDLLPSAQGPPQAYAPLAVSARDYATALELFDRAPKGPWPRFWPELASHAAAAVGAGDIPRGVSLADAAVADFEARFAGLHRDADRVLASDDMWAAYLFLTAAQAKLALVAQADDAAAETARGRAFELADRARSLALGALVADVSGEDVSDALVRSWRQAAAEWQAGYERLHRAYVRESPAEVVAEAIEAMVPLELKLTTVEAEVEERAPEALARHRRPQPPTRLQDVQAALPAGAVLLEYQLFDRDLLLWAVTADAVAYRATSTDSAAIARLTNTVQHTCANGDPAEDAAELAELLLGPAARVLEASTRVIVVAYGRLNGLPYHVLPLAGRPLGETHVVSYLPAASLLLTATVDERIPARTALVVGDPAFDPGVHPSLRRLPGAAVEAEAVAEIYSGRALVSDAATEPALRAELGGHDVLHLAAHGRLDAVAPSASSIILAGRDELTVADLLGMRADAELAVLSACDSGRGRGTVGGDVVGLARGLIAAGVRRSVVSLWPVDDAAACVTMNLFHRHIVEGAPVAAALHAAQRTVHGLSGADIVAHYVKLGGDSGEAATTRRRGASADRSGTLPLDPELVDDLTDDEPVDALSGHLARVWAPFIVIGV